MEEEVQEQKDHYILIVALSQMIIIWEVEEVDRAVLRRLLELVGVEDILILRTMALIILQAVVAAVLLQELLVGAVDLCVDGCDTGRQEADQAEVPALLRGEGGAPVEAGRSQDGSASDIHLDS